MGDFNLEPDGKRLGHFVDSTNLVNLVKSNTYVKGSGSFIELILTIGKYSFKSTTSYEIELYAHNFIKLLFSRKRPSFSFIEIMKNFIFDNFKKVIFTQS